MHRPIRLGFAAVAAMVVVGPALGLHTLAAAGPCPSHVIEPALPNTGTSTYDWPVQTFYAADTLILSVTVWRRAGAEHTYDGGAVLRLLNTYASGVPDIDSVLFTSPALVVHGSSTEPVPLVFEFNPPLRLPHPGEYAFQCRPAGLYVDLLAWSWDLPPYGGGYWGGVLWTTGRCCYPLCSYPHDDLIFRIEFVQGWTLGQASLERADAQPCRVDISWMSGSGVTSATILRRTASTNWDSVGTVLADGAGRLAFVDTTVVPGMRYAYSLRVNDCSSYGENCVDVPGGLGLAPVSATPVAGQLRLTWSAAVGRTFTATVWRRDTGGWHVVGSAAPDGSGQVVFDDAHVRGGDDYDYRLGVNLCDREVYLDQLSGVRMPCGADLPALAVQRRPCALLLRWSTPDSSRHSVNLYRRAAGSDAWSLLGSVTSDSLGHSVYEDQPLLPNGRYTYRLGATTTYCNEAFSDQLSIAVPGPQVTGGTARAYLDHVSVSWSVGGPKDAVLKVYRTPGDTGWQPMAQVEPDDFGQVRYEDTDLSSTAPHPGYGYRLGITQCGQEAFYGTVWTDLPYALALRGVRPNPTDGDLTLQFSLPDAAPAKVEVMDLAGRRVLARDVGKLGAGEHAVNLTAERRLPSGVYVIRLTRAGQARTTRTVIVRQRPGYPPYR